MRSIGGWLCLLALPIGAAPIPITGTISSEGNTIILSGPGLRVDAHHSWDFTLPYRVCDLARTPGCDVSGAFSFERFLGDDDSWLVEFNGRRIELYDRTGTVGGLVRWMAAPIPFQPPGTVVTEPIRLLGNIWAEDESGFRFMDVNVEAAGTIDLFVQPCENYLCNVEIPMAVNMQSAFSGTATPVLEPGTAGVIALGLLVALIQRSQIGC